MNTGSGFKVSSYFSPAMAQWRTLSAGWLEYVIIVGTFFVLIGGAFVWAAFFRRRGRRHRHHHHHETTGWEKSAEDSHHSSGPSLFGRKKKRRRSTHRPMNPTLADTGGLPQARGDAPVEPYP